MEDKLEMKEVVIEVVVLMVIKEVVIEVVVVMVMVTTKRMVMTRLNGWQIRNGVPEKLGWPEDLTMDGRN